MTHVLAIVALGLLCGGWIVLQRALGEPDGRGEPDCGACARGGDPAGPACGRPRGEARTSWYTRRARTRMAKIEVTRTGAGRFRVEVREGSGSTVHEVTAGEADVRRYAGTASPEELVRASFEFLLEREPKESILRSFELPVIERYFPEYPRRIRERLSGTR